MIAGEQTGEGFNAEATGARIVAIANQKGGVGKTTTAVNLSAALADLGLQVVVVDLDPQGNASTGLGVDHRHRPLTTYQVLTGRAEADEALQQTAISGLRVLPSTVDLAGAEIELVGQFARETLLQRALEPIRHSADVVVLDCPPSLGLLTVNALAAADEVLVPIQCEYFALEGLGQLLKNLRLIQRNVNPNLRLNGIVLTMFDARTKLSEQVVAEVRAYFGPQAYETVVPRSVRLSEAPGFGLPVIRYDPSSRGAKAYRALAAEFLSRKPGEAVPIALPASLEEFPSDRHVAGAATTQPTLTSQPAVTSERAAADEPAGAPAGTGTRDPSEPVDEGDWSEPSKRSRWPFRRSRGGVA